MRFYPIWAVASVTAVALAGCSSGGDAADSSSVQATTTATSAQPHTPAPGATEVAPGGATTAIGSDAESTEEEYSKACQAAKAWIDEQGGDRKAQVEAFLKHIQDPSTPPGPATYGTPWAELSPGRQAAVIVAVQAGADSLC